MLVERVSGTTLQAFCRKEFFEPSEMASTQWRDDFRRIVPNRAIAYALHGAEWRQEMPFEDVYGNGGLLSTVGDLLKWNDNITSGKLHASIFQLMQKPGSLTDGRPVNYGFGLFLYHFQGLEEISHSGANMAGTHPFQRPFDRGDLQRGFSGCYWTGTPDRQPLPRRCTAGPTTGIGDT